jgi:hypothetical protein
MLRKSLLFLATMALAGLPIAATPLRAQDADSDDDASVVDSASANFTTSYQAGYIAGFDVAYPGAPVVAPPAPSGYASGTEAWFAGWADGYTVAGVADKPYWMIGPVYYPHYGIFISPAGLIAGYATGYTVVNGVVFYLGARWVAPANVIPAGSIAFINSRHAAQAAWVLPRSLANSRRVGLTPPPFKPGTISLASIAPKQILANRANLRPSTGFIVSSAKLPPQQIAASKKLTTGHTALAQPQAKTSKDIVNRANAAKHTINQAKTTPNRTVTHKGNRQSVHRTVSNGTRSNNNVALSQGVRHDNPLRSNPVRNNPVRVNSVHVNTVHVASVPQFHPAPARVYHVPPPPVYRAPAYHSMPTFRRF